MHHHPHHSHVLQLDIQGTPQAWISLEHAAIHVATGSVVRRETQTLTGLAFVS